MPFPKLGAVTEAPKKVAAGAAIGAGGIAAGLGLIASSPLWTIPVLILGAKLPQIALDAAVTKIYKKDVEGYIEKYKSSRSSPKSITCGDAGDEISASRADPKRADSAFKTIEVDKQNISLSDSTRNLIQTEFSKISSTTALQKSLGDFKKSLEAANEVIKADQATDKGQPTNDYSSVNFKSLVSELKGDVVLALE